MNFTSPFQAKAWFFFLAWHAKLYGMTSASFHKFCLTPYFLCLFYWCSTVLLLRIKLLKICFFLLIFAFSSLKQLCIPEWFPYLRYNWNTPWQNIITILVSLADHFSNFICFPITFNKSLHRFWNIIWLDFIRILYLGFPYGSLVVPCLYLLQHIFSYLKRWRFSRLFSRLSSLFS